MIQCIFGLKRVCFPPKYPAPFISFVDNVMVERYVYIFSSKFSSCVCLLDLYILSKTWFDPPFITKKMFSVSLDRNIHFHITDIRRNRFSKIALWPLCCRRLFCLCFLFWELNHTFSNKLRIAFCCTSSPIWERNSFETFFEFSSSDIHVKNKLLVSYVHACSVSWTRKSFYGKKK